MNTELESIVWSEAERPTTLEDCILPKNTKKMLKDQVANGNLSNLLMIGQAGIGKTTVAMAVAKDIGADLLYVNASLETSIDVIRTKVISFSSSVSLTESPKIVLLDECLHEEEEVRIGTLKEWRATKLRNLLRDVEYPIISFNMETSTFENDTCYVVSDKEDELWEVVTHQGKTITVNKKHPFIVYDSDIVLKINSWGTALDSNLFKEKSISSGLLKGDLICCYDTYSIFDDNCSLSRVDSITKLDKPGRVINLCVNKNHTIVSANGMVTHNCDGLSQNAQNSLKGVFQEFANTKFFMTSNNGAKIIEPLHSRSIVLDFTVSKEEKPKLAIEFFKRVSVILNKRGIKFDSKAVAEIIQRYFPDFRRTLNELQRYAASGQIDSGILLTRTSTDYQSLINYLADKDFKNMRLWVSEHQGDDPSQLFKNFYEHAYDIVENASLPNLILLLSDYQFKAAHAIDQTINLAAFCTEAMIQLQFKKK